MNDDPDRPDDDRFPISATLFTTYLRCPQQALARLQGVYPVPSRASFKGALAHRIFARHLTVAPIEPDEFVQICRQETGANLNQQLAAVGLKPSQFDAVVSEVSELYERFRGVPTEGFSGAEVSFEFAAADFDVRGRIDAVYRDEEGIRIVDWKTGKDLGESVAAQLDFYAWAWSLAHGGQPATTEAYSLVTGERIERRHDPSDLARTAAAVEEMAAVLAAAMAEGRELARTAGPHCRWCPLLDDCDEGAAAASVLGP